MPSLRELWQYMCEHDKSISQSALALLWALVEAVEPEKHTCEECRGYKDRAKCPRWRAPRPDDPTCLNFALESPSPAVEPENTELAEAKAEIERLRKALANEKEGSDWLTESFESLDKRAAKLKSAGNAYMRRCDELERLLAVQKASHADAEIGRLVRGMRRGSNLLHTGPFGAAKSDWVAQHLPDTYEWADDPTEALRAIQEVGDDEA